MKLAENHLGGQILYQKSRRSKKRCQPFIIRQKKQEKYLCDDKSVA